MKAFFRLAEVVPMIGVIYIYIYITAIWIYIYTIYLYIELRGRVRRAYLFNSHALNKVMLCVDCVSTLILTMLLISMIFTLLHPFSSLQCWGCFLASLIYPTYSHLYHCTIAEMLIFQFLGRAVAAVRFRLRKTHGHSVSGGPLFRWVTHELPKNWWPNHFGILQYVQTNMWLDICHMYYALKLFEKYPLPTIQLPGNERETSEYCEKKHHMFFW